MWQSSKRKNQEILNRQKLEKEESFDFGRISLFFLHGEYKDAAQVIDDRTWSDLDFDELFISMDRTASSIGQQYLYSRLRFTSNDPDQSKSFEPIMDHLSYHPESREEAILELDRLNSPGAYFLQRLFFAENLEKPKWYGLIPFFSGAAIVSLLSGFFYPIAIFIALLLISVNITVHFWNKNNLLGYSNVIPQLLILHKVATRLNAKGLFLKSGKEVSTALDALMKIKRSAVLFRWESSAKAELAEVGEYVMDLLKGAFLIEPIVFFKLMKQLEAHKKETKEIFEAVGHLDAAISIMTWRESLPYYCHPTFDQGLVKTWHSAEIYHPLIENPVANDLKLPGQKSILLSGSNMSGKTTFIRTVGINAWLAQTIHTACAKALTLSRFNVYSAIRISDDLMEETSYYYEEVKTMKRFTQESCSGHFNLFLLDEIFKGTNTIERIASGKAILSYLNQPSNLVLCSTHDLELIDYLQEEYEYFHFEETIADDELIFDYKLKNGRLNHTNAIRILELNDFPEVLTNEAKSLAQKLLRIKNISKEGNS
jgi:hypothetical protein